MDVQIQNQENVAILERLVSAIQQIPAPNGTGLGIWRSKRRLYACCTRCKYSIEITRNQVKGQIR